MVLDEPKWSSIQSLVEGLLATTPEQSPLRPEILRAVGRTGLVEAIDLSFLTDDDIESLSSLKDVKTFIRCAREKAQGGGPLGSRVSLFGLTGKLLGSNRRLERWTSVAPLRPPGVESEPRQRCRALPWLRQWARWCSFLPPSLPGL